LPVDWFIGAGPGTYIKDQLGIPKSLLDDFRDARIGFAEISVVDADGVVRVLMIPVLQNTAVLLVEYREAAYLLP
jgi:hypothetical protein